jgi:hypothetical protein
MAQASTDAPNTCGTRKDRVPSPNCGVGLLAFDFRRATPRSGRVSLREVAAARALHAMRMIQLLFKGHSTGGDKTVGPAPAFRIAGNFIRAEPSGTILARYEDYHWDIDGAAYTSYHCEAPVAIHFEEFLGGKSSKFGPFKNVHTADGVMYCDGEMFARYMDESLLWLATPTRTHWPMLVIKAAGAQTT